MAWVINNAWKWLTSCSIIIDIIFAFLFNQEEITPSWDLAIDGIVIVFMTFCFIVRTNINLFSLQSKQKKRNKVYLTYISKPIFFIQR